MWLNLKLEIKGDPIHLAVRLLILFVNGSRSDLYGASVVEFKVGV